MDFMEEAYTTSAYKYAVFQGPKIPLVALTGNYTDYGKDTNKDGILDYLTVDAGSTWPSRGMLLQKQDWWTGTVMKSSGLKTPLLI